MAFSPGRSCFSSRLRCHSPRRDKIIVFVAGGRCDRGLHDRLSFTPDSSHPLTPRAEASQGRFFISPSDLSREELGSASSNPSVVAVGFGIGDRVLRLHSARLLPSVGCLRTTAGVFVTSVLLCSEISCSFWEQP